MELRHELEEIAPISAAHVKDRDEQQFDSACLPLSLTLSLRGSLSVSAESPLARLIEG